LDQVADSTRIHQARTEIDELTHSLKENQLAAQKPHGDWPVLDNEADRITQQASRAAAVLRDEMDRAEKALQSLSRAVAAVRRARSWTGRYGVSITGGPGSDLLAQARDLLQRGLYEEAGRHAIWACQKAAAAIEAAEAEVRRQRRLAREREAAERRRRQAAERARRAAWSASRSSFGSKRSGFGSSSFSSGSGFRSSSFSKGSGFKTSGW
jgi:hypothetical protein